MKAIRIDAFGGQDALRLQDVSEPVPAAGEMVVRVEAAGVNFIDVYHRTGLYPNPLPLVPGLEGAGVVTALGPQVDAFRVGDRVAWTSALGSYAESVRLPAQQAVAVPAGVDSRTAAALMLQGMTAQYLSTSTFPLAKGHTCLVHAAAGGVGLLLVQWLAARGVRVIGTVGSAAKEQQARAAGCELVLRSDDPELARKVREATGDAGVAVSYDGVGAATWQASLASMARRGTLVSFGNASGPVTGVELGTLARHGSLFVTRPTMFDYYRDPAERAAGAARLWEMIASGKVKVTVGQTYPLREAAQAHRDLEARRTTGSTLLLP
jgi:NADPH2:quinone reductase